MIEKETIMLRASHLTSLTRAAVAEPNNLHERISNNDRIADLVANLSSLGDAHLINKQYASALECFESALYLNPDSDAAQLGRNRAYREIIPRWHFEMLNDEQRNTAFERALAKAVSPATTVLDIGSGTGLLAMMAARAGAQEIISCEMVSPLAELARETVKRNGFADKVTVKNKKSTQLIVGLDMSRRANLLVTEIVDCGLLGEDILPSITHAKAALLTPDAQIIPRAATVYAMVVESQRLRDLNYAGICAGFDVSLIQKYATARYFPVRLAAFDYVPLTEPFQVFSFDFTGELIAKERRRIHVPVVRSGVCQNIIFWFDMHLDDEISISNRPGVPTHWEQALQCLEEEVNVREGDELVLDAEHDASSIFFKMKMPLSA